MASLCGAMDDVTAGHGRVVLLSGEPGIGKTRTAEQLSVYASERGAQVLWGRCYEGEGAPAFWPWLEVIRGGIRLVGNEALRAALGSATAELSHWVPELRESIAAPAERSSDSPETRFRLFEGVARFFATIAHRAPLLVVLDDVHGADRSSLLLLQFLVRQVHELRVLILATYRESGLRIDDALAATVADLGRESTTTRITLQGLGEPEIETLVRSCAGVALPGGLIRSIRLRTEGNPLFVTEFVRALEHQPRREPAWDADIPITVHAIIAQRLQPLSRDCRQVLDVAAVIGREFDLSLLRAAITQIQLVATGTREPDMAEAIEEAAGAGILAPSPESRQRCRFTHALVRDVIIAELGFEAGARVHASVGTALEQRLDAAAHVAELAYHFAEADRATTGDRTEGEGSHRRRAIQYARQAGHQAMAVLAYEEGVHWFGQALELNEALPDRGAEHCALLVDLGIAQREAGDLDASKVTLLRAAALAKTERQPDELARAALHFGTKIVWGEQFAPDHALLQLLETATAAYGDAQNVTHARVLARLALALRFSSDGERRLYLSRRALEMARHLEASAVIAEALHSWLATHWQPDNLDERIALAGEMATRAERLRDLDLTILGYSWKTKLLAESGDWMASDNDFSRFEQFARQSRLTIHLWWAHHARAARAIQHGRFAEAETLTQQAAVLEQKLSSGPPLGYLMQMVSLWSIRGDREPLEAVLARQGTGGPSPGVVVQCSRANIACELGRADEARVALQLLGANEFADFPLDETWLSCLHYLAGVCAFLDDATHAERIADLLAPYDRRAVINVGSGVYLAPVAYDLALAETVLTRWDDAERHFRQALAMNRAAAARPALLRSQYEYARMLLRRGQPSDASQARDLLADVVAGGLELGMPLLIERARSLQIATDEASPSGQAGPARRLPGPREFRRDGDYWTLRYDDTTIQLKHSRGLQYLQCLLGHPGQEFLALDLLVRSRATPSVGAAALPSVEQAALPTLDGTSRAAYRNRLTELRETLGEAETCNDLGAAERARAEIQFLEDELAAAIGLGGRQRPTGSTNERARSTVTKGIKSTIARIRSAHRGLGRHLEHAVRTGIFCAYLPDADDPPWQF